MERNITRMITLLARKSQMCIAKALSEYDLTAAEQPFFMALQHYEGITQEELTAMVCVDKAVTARVVKSLEEKGFLVRRQDERDRRQKRIYPTARTKQYGEAVLSKLLHLNDRIIQDMDPEELTVTYHTLLKMEQNLAAILDDRKIRDGGKENGTIR